MTVLYRKYRPRTLDEVVGQSPIKNFIKSCFEKNKLPHALIFAGPRGTGKTTIARIVALIANCKNSKPEDCSPCGKCDSCKHILEGNNLSDLNEIDAASNRGIDNIRQINEMVGLLPHFGTKKVYLIDEAHMITREAFNAFLKTLEEPPEHVMFIMATTESEKFPDTILSRCQLLNFQTVSDEELKKHLEEISNKEEIKIDSESLDLIVNYSEGCVRDALSLLEQVSSLSVLTVEEISKFLNIIGPKDIENLHSMMIDLNEKGIHSFFDKVNNLSLSARNILKQLIRATEIKLEEKGTQSKEGNYLFQLLKNLVEASLRLHSSISPVSNIKIAFLETMIYINKSSNPKTPSRTINNSQPSTNKLVTDRNKQLDQISNVQPITNNPISQPQKSPNKSGVEHLGIKDPIIKGLLMGQKIDKEESKVIIYANSGFIYEKLIAKKTEISKEFDKSVEILGPEKSTSNTESVISSPQTTKPKSDAENNLLDIFG